MEIKKERKKLLDSRKLRKALEISNILSIILAFLHLLISNLKGDELCIYNTGITLGFLKGRFDLIAAVNAIILVFLFIGILISYYSERRKNVEHSSYSSRGFNNILKQLLKKCAPESDLLDLLVRSYSINIFAAGLSNYIDRIMNKAVCDYINIELASLEAPIFNLNDFVITISTLFLLGNLIYYELKQSE